MVWLRNLIRGLRRWSWHDPSARDVDEELRFHLDMQTRDNIDAGVAPDEARYVARRRFGNVGLIKDLSREARGVISLETFAQDIRYGARMLVRKPTFTLVAVVILAVGIGASTTMFSVVNSIVLQPLKYQDPERLVVIWSRNPVLDIEMNQVSEPDFEDWRWEAKSFENIAGFRWWGLDYAGDGVEPAELFSIQMSVDAFEMLGVEPILGRGFRREDAEPGAARVALLNHGTWERRFGTDPSVVGRTLRLDQLPYTVIGVMPAGFEFPSAGAEIWEPLIRRNRAIPGNRAQRDLQTIARLNPGVSIEQAQAELDVIAAGLAEAYPDTNLDWGTTVVSAHEQAVGSVRYSLWILFGTVSFVLLIACANVANLLLTRAAARGKEMAVRRALGAGRIRLVRQLLSESAMLGLVAGSAGVGLTLWVLGFLRAVNPWNLPRANEIELDTSVLVFSFGLPLLCGIAFGLVPAIQASRVGIGESLKESGRTLSGSVRKHRTMSLLVVTEVAIGVLLLVSGGLLARSFMTLRSVDPGFVTEDALAVRMFLPGSKYSEDTQIAAFFGSAMERIAALPGVSSVGATTALPMDPVGIDFDLPFVILDRPPPSRGQEPQANYRIVSPDYHRALGASLVNGRYLNPFDREDAPGAALINLSMARRYFPDEDPVGKSLRIFGGPLGGVKEIVGVVVDTRHYGLDQAPAPEMYVPLGQAAMSGMALVVRTTTDPAGLTDSIKQAVWSVDSDQTMAIQTLVELVDTSVAPERLNMTLMVAFASVAVLLLIVGVYAVLSYSVSERTHEFGLRVAMGAGSREIMAMVLRKALGLTFFGMTFGLAASLLFTRVLGSMLFEVTPTDPWTLGGMSLAVLVVALIASALPARRATRVDPMVALRYE